MTEELVRVRRHLRDGKPVNEHIRRPPRVGPKTSYEHVLLDRAKDLRRQRGKQEALAGVARRVGDRDSAKMHDTNAARLAELELGVRSQLATRIFERMRREGKL